MLVGFFVLNSAINYPENTGRNNQGIRVILAVLHPFQLFFHRRDLRLIGMYPSKSVVCPLGMSACDPLSVGRRKG
jgi:hypothetical protein